MVEQDTLYEKVKTKFATAHQNGTHKERDHGDAPKPPGGALFWRNVGNPLQNFEITPNIDIVGNSKLMAYAPIEYGCKSKQSEFARTGQYLKLCWF